MKKSSALMTPPFNDLSNRCKDSTIQVQTIIVLDEFARNPSTMLKVSIETGILRANICRYVAKWQRQNEIFLLMKGICPISKHLAGFYTTVAPSNLPIQGKLF